MARAVTMTLEWKSRNHCAIVRPMFRSVLSILAAAFVMFVTGCATPRGTSATMSVTLVSAEVVRVRGKDIAVAALPKRLKSLGAGSNTPIAVSVPADAPKGELSELTRSLSKAGFRRVLFVKPQHATAVVTDQP